MIYGRRVEQAREFRGLTQAALASLVDVRQPSIASIEAGGNQPSAETMVALSEKLQFPKAFFEREPNRFIASGTLQFRARESMPSKERKRAQQYAHLVFEAAFVLAKGLQLPALRIPRLSGDPEEIAKTVRSELGLSPNLPIRHLINALERAGAFVFVLPDLADKCDGFSAWGGDTVVRPGIFLNSDVPPDRQRHTIAHEVGELAMLDLPVGSEREDLASRFAGALLVPAEPFAASLTPPITLSDFIPLKAVWGVSIASLIMRAFHLGLIDAKRYRSLFVQMSARGWRSDEPGSGDTVAERPRAFRKMIEMLFGQPPNYQAIEEALALDPWFVRQLVNSQISAEEIAAASKATTGQRAPIVPISSRPKAKEARIVDDDFLIRERL